MPPSRPQVPIRGRTEWPQSVDKQVDHGARPRAAEEPRPSPVHAQSPHRAQGLWLHTTRRMGALWGPSQEEHALQAPMPETAAESAGGEQKPGKNGKPLWKGWR